MPPYGALININIRIPVVPNDDPVKLVIETAKLAGLTISE